MLFTKYARTTATSISCVGKRRRLRGLGIWCHSGNCHERTEPGSGLPRAGVTLEYSRKPLLHDSMTMERFRLSICLLERGKLLCEIGRASCSERVQIPVG